MITVSPTDPSHLRRSNHRVPVFSLLCLIPMLSFVSDVNADMVFKDLPVTGADVAQALELNPADYQIRKWEITFGSAKQITLRATSLGGHTRDFDVPGVSQSVTLATYVPKDGGPVKPLRFWLSGSGGAIASSFAIDTSKVKFTRSGDINGIFSVEGAATEVFSKSEYQLQIVASGGSQKDERKTP